MFIEAETGEKLHVIAAGNRFVNDTDETKHVVVEVPPNSEARARKKQSRISKARESFTMLFKSKLQALITAGELSEKEMAVLFVLASFMDYDGLCYVQDGYGQKQRMTVSMLDKLMGWQSSKKTLRAVLDSLEHKGLIVRVKHGRVKYVDPNPEVIFCGDVALRNKQAKLFLMKQQKMGGKTHEETGS